MADIFANLTRAEKLEAIRLLEERERRIRETQIARYKPYPKQQEFHAAGLNHRERLFRAGNQLGKSYSGGAEAAYHLTGLYPEATTLRCGSSLWCRARWRIPYFWHGA